MGLGRATAHALARRGWSLVVDARRPDLPRRRDARAGRRDRAARRRDRPGAPRPSWRPRCTARGRLDLLVNNASRLGPSPQPELGSYPLDELSRVYETNVFAPLALIQLLAGPLAAAAGTIVNVSSDAATEAYPGWGGYGSTKAALDQLTAVLGRGAAVAALLRVRPRRHAHRPAPAGLPRGGHLRPAGAGSGGGGAAAADHRAAAERPLPDEPTSPSRRCPGEAAPAGPPPEARGLARDGVRLLVATPDGVLHARFSDLPRYLAPGDLLVVNTSATVAAAVPGRRGDGRPVLVHWSGRLADGT